MAKQSPQSEPLHVHTSSPYDHFSLGPRFTDLQPIGCGANGLVFSATDGDCDKKVAIKKISFHDNISCKYALREIKILRRIQHENVVSFCELLGADGRPLDGEGAVNYNELRSVYIIQELLDTDLHRLLQGGQLSEDHVRLFLYQMMRALKYIHSANILHRDLKPSNILINCDNLLLKIADFGLARVVDPAYNHNGFLTENMGTCWYRSPELILTPREYTKAIDQWSVGCILAEMLTGKPLFPGAQEFDQIRLVLDTISLEEEDWSFVLSVMSNKLLKNHPLTTRTPLHERLHTISPLAMDLLAGLVTFNPHHRLTACEALAHPYLQHLALATDEPVARQPFCIEHEVEDLSPTILKRMIFEETLSSHETCGYRIDACGETVDTNKSHQRTVITEDRNKSHHQRAAVAEDRNKISEKAELNEKRNKLEKKVTDKQTNKEQLRTSEIVDTNKIDQMATRETNKSQLKHKISEDVCDLNGNPTGPNQTMLSQDILCPKSNSIPKLELQKEKFHRDEEEEKDEAEFSPRKIEEDLQIAHGSDTLKIPIECSDTGDENGKKHIESSKIKETVKPRKEEKKSHNTEIKDDLLMFENVKNSAKLIKYDSELLIVLDDTENFKEYSQLSPKESPDKEKLIDCNHCSYEKECFSLKDYDENERNIQYTIAQSFEQQKPNVETTNEQNGLIFESIFDPIPDEFADKEEFNMRQKLNLDNIINTSSGLGRSRPHHQSSRWSGCLVRSPATSDLEMEEMYRLPTDHLFMDRNAANEKLKLRRLSGVRDSAPPHAKLHQQINERLKQEEGYGDQACGGFDIYNMYDTDLRNVDGFSSVTNCKQSQERIPLVSTVLQANSPISSQEGGSGRPLEASSGKPEVAHVSNQSASDSHILTSLSQEGSIERPVWGTHNSPLEGSSERPWVSQGMQISSNSGAKPKTVKSKQKAL